MSVIESWNEWDPLRSAFLGSLEGKVLSPNDEPAVARKYQNYAEYQFPISNRVDDNFSEAQRLVEKFGEVLKEEGIEVTRPKPIDFNKAVSTPIFDASKGSGCTCPRDVMFIHGKHVIEATMSWRSRYFEHYAWRAAMTEAYRRDSAIRWSCAPKPVLSDASFQAAPALTLSEEEILFDAADCRRFGKDVFVQHAHTANAAGRDWIRRTLGADGIRVHEFEFEHATYSHIDAKITPVDDDTLLWTAAERPTAAMFKLFEENEWKMMEMPARTTCITEEDQTGPGIHLNMAVLRPSVVIAEATEKALIKTMREQGIDVIPVDFAAAYMYGGSFNCWTLDILRNGSLKSYFPLLDRAEETEGLKRKLDSIPTPLTPRRRLGVEEN